MHKDGLAELWLLVPQHTHARGAMASSSVSCLPSPSLQHFSHRAPASMHFYQVPSLALFSPPLRFLVSSPAHPCILSAFLIKSQSYLPNHNSQISIFPKQVSWLVPQTSVIAFLFCYPVPSALTRKPNHPLPAGLPGGKSGNREKNKKPLSSDARKELTSHSTPL